MRIVVFCPSPIGDTVMATPALRALRASYPDATIHGVLKPTTAPALDGAPWMDERILFDPRSREGRFGSWALLRRLRQERYDLGVLFPNSHRSALLALIGGVRRRVGHAHGLRGLLLTDRLPMPRDARGKRLPTPAVETFARLVRHLGCRIDSLRLELFTTEADEQAADRAWSELGLHGNRPVVCLNNGGAYGPAKCWPNDYFSALARRLATETDVDVLVVCGPAERTSAQEIVVGAAHPHVRSLADQSLSLGLTKACIRRSAVLVTTDSGPRHFATAFGVPVVTLFGPTHIAWTRTNHPHAIHLQKRLPCGPCQRPVCPLGHTRCMRELEPATVYAATLRLLGTAREATCANGS
jgi:heptosyltransferase-2